MSPVTLFRRATSTRYIFLLSGLAFVLWSLASSVIPKVSTLPALLQLDLDRGTTPAEPAANTTPSNLSVSNSLDVWPHLGIGIAHAHIYVISLAYRQERRGQMELLRSAQNLTWTVIDATPRNATLVGQILDWVVHQRTDGRELGWTFHWPPQINALSAKHATPLDPSGSDTWAKMSPPTKSKSGKSGAPTPSALPCAARDDFIPTLRDDSPDWMILSPAKVACWHSHVSVIRRFIDGQDAIQVDHRRDDEVAIILEDDIDMEKNISARLSQVWTSLPAGWDIVFLGHCWSDESLYPSLTEFKDTNLHPSNYPKCTHAYALSLPGARRLLQHLRYPPFAYSRSLDQAFAWLIRSGRLRSYSIVPSLVIQRKKEISDISPGAESVWRERLQDGVFQA